MEKLLKTLTYQHMIDHLFSAESFWVAAMPGIYDELAQAIIEAKKINPQLELNIIIDPKESAFRSHLGDVNAINELLREGVSIKYIPNHRLGFLISDQGGWFIFPQSRAIEKEPAGYNAIRMSAVTKNELLLHFCGRQSTQDMVEEYTEEMRELVKIKDQVNNEGKTEFTPAPLDDDEFDHVNHLINQNPPPSPDFKRLYDVYSTKIKFVEFAVKGIKFHQKTIPISNDVLNLIDVDFRDQISTRLDLFGKNEREEIQDLLNSINQKVETIRETYLKRVSSRNKSVLAAEKLSAFSNQIKMLRESYQDIQPEIMRIVMKSRILVKNRFKKELLHTYRNDPPEQLIEYREDDQFELFVDDYVTKIVEKLPIPSPQSLINSFEVTKQIYDPTHDDFRDEDFIKELEDIGFLDHADKEAIVKEFKALGVQK